MIERRHPLFAGLRSHKFRNPGVAARIQKIFFVDDEVPEHKDSHASSSHEVSLEPTSKRREDLGKHNVHIHFPQRPKLRDLQKDQNYKGPHAGRRNGEAVPHTEKFGDLITADHKVLSGQL